MIARLAAVVVASGLLFACDAGNTSLPAPEKLTELATGVYCGMVLTEHAGPKAQVFEKGKSDALWFTAVRDAVAYSRLPGEAQHVIAIYVHDMGRATSWENPQPEGIWILADEAYYVVGSIKRGGMGMIEVVPFGQYEQAAAFAAQFGGKVVKYDDIPASSLFPDLEEDKPGTASVEKSKVIQ